VILSLALETGLLGLDLLLELQELRIDGRSRRSGQGVADLGQGRLDEAEAPVGLVALLATPTLLLFPAAVLLLALGVLLGHVLHFSAPLLVAAPVVLLDATHPIVVATGPLEGRRRHPAPGLPARKLRREGRHDGRRWRRLLGHADGGQRRRVRPPGRRAVEVGGSQRRPRLPAAATQGLPLASKSGSRERRRCWSLHRAVGAGLRAGREDRRAHGVRRHPLRVLAGIPGPLPVHLVASSVYSHERVVPPAGPLGEKPVLEVEHVLTRPARSRRSPLGLARHFDGLPP
jgi:hypothetical protein